MKNYKLYGNQPYTIAVIHGGPGAAAGEMYPVAQELAPDHGIIKPYQTKLTIDEQVQELKQTLEAHASFPITLIGHSWGAFLSFIFAAQYPTLVKKLILVSSGPFTHEYAKDIMDMRLSRMTPDEKKLFENLLQKLNDPTSTNKNETFAQLGELIGKVDSFDPIEQPKPDSICRYDIYQSVWPEAAALRKSGTLLKLGTKITCPVVALHGDHDPHSAEGVQQPLMQTLKDFTFILLQNCGHTPWLEKQAQEEFYALLKQELC